MNQSSPSQSPSVVPLPNQPREDTLPCHSIPEDRFEAACRELARFAFPELKRFELKNAKGDKQYEVDVECFNDNQQPEVVIQCKRYKEISPSKITDWTKGFIDELSGHWHGKGVKHYILAITVDGNSDNINKKVKAACDLIKAKGLEFSIWFNADLTNFFRKDPSFVRHFFHEAWVDAISAGPVQRSSGNQMSGLATGGESASLSKIAQLGSAVTAEVEGRIDLLEKGAKAGKPAELREYLQDLYEVKAKWEPLGDTTKSRILRRLSLFLVNEGDAKKARDCFELANEFGKAKDKTAEAHLTNIESGLDAAIKFLKGCDLPSEKEVLSSFLIFSDKLRHAEQQLKQCPKSAERERLFALLSLKKGDGEKAAKYAKEAVELSPTTYGAKLSLLLAHISAAMVKGQKVELTPAPNPFNIYVFREDDEAIRHIEQAEVCADQIIQTTEPSIANQVKVWKLVCLLAHPLKRIEANSYFQRQADDQNIDALLIAWAISAPLRVNHSKLRKLLEDRVRAGSGTSTDVVVSALLVNDKSNGDSKKAAAVIRKLKNRFETEIDFLNEWQAMFDGTSPSQTIADIAAEKSDDFDELVEQANSVVNSNPDFVVSAAEVLARRSAFRQLHGLTEALLSIGNAKSIELASVGLIETGAPEQAIEIVDGHEAAFFRNQLPTHMLRLRAIAAERAGKRGEALKSLELLDEQDPTLESKINLIRSAYMLSDEKRLVRYSRDLLSLDDDAGQLYVQVAGVVGPHDPQLAKSLLQRYSQTNELRVEDVPFLIELSQHVELGEVISEERYREAFGAFVENGKGIITFENVEDLLSYIAKQADQKRQFRKGWLKGGMPVHQAFADDSRAVAKLYLGKIEHIYSSSDEKYPPLIRAPGFDVVPIARPDNDRRPEILLDVTALLYAIRFDLLDHIEQAFSISIAHLTLAVLENMERELSVAARQISSSDIALFDDFKRQNIAYVVIADEQQVADMKQVERQFEVPPDSDAMIAILRQVQIEGALTLGEFRSLLDDLFISELPATSQIDTPQNLLVGSGLLLTLVRHRAIDAFSQHTRLFVRKSEFEHLDKTIERTRDEQFVYEQVRALRSHVLGRVRENTYRTIENLDPSKQTESGNIPVTLESVRTALKALDEQPNLLVWIEDRFVSRHQLPRIVTLDHVIQYLFEAGIIDAQQLSTIERTRAESGHGFLKFDADTVFSELKMLVQGQEAFRENTSIRRQRSFFSNQIELLTFLDWGEHRTIDGHFIGDPRHALDALYFVTDLFSQIWCSRDIDINDKRKLSHWVWANCRVELANRNHSEDAQERYETNLSLLLLHNLTWPFTEKLQSEGAEWEHYKDYLDWYCDNILMPRLAFDQRLRRRFVASIANLLSARISTSDDNNSDIAPEIVSRFYCKEVYAFLQMIDVDLRLEILNFDDFAKKIYVSIDNSISTSVGRYMATSVCESIEKALLEKTERGELEADITTAEGETHSLIVQDIEREIPTVSIKRNSDLIYLQDIAVAISLPNREARKRAAFSIKDSLHTTREVAESICKAISEANEVSKRLHALKVAHLLDFSFAEERLKETLVDREDVSIELFSLPAVAALENYLRIDLTGEQPLEVVLKGGFDVLSRDMGMETARERFSACPLDVTFFGSVEPKFPVRADTMFQLANVVRDADLDSIESDKNLVQIFEFVCESVKDQSDFFAALVRRGAKYAAVTSDWQQVSAPARITLLWIWAERICAAFAFAGIDVKRLKVWLDRQRVPGFFMPLVCAKSDRDVDLRWGSELSADEVRHFIFGDIRHGISRITDDGLRRTVGELVGMHVEGAWYPNSSLLLASGDSAEGLRRLPTVEEVIETDCCAERDRLRDLNKKVFIEKIMDFLNSDADLSEYCVFLLMCRASDFSEEQQKLVTTHVSSLLLAKINKMDARECTGFFKLLGELCGSINREDILEETISSTIKSHLSQLPVPRLPYSVNADGNTSEKLFANIQEAFFAYCRAREGAPSELVNQFFNMMTKTSRIWPDAQGSFICVASYCFEQLPLSVAASAWASFERLRGGASLH
ncbi:tetratricopeptide repeat protein [Martelella limonii]|uniref:tetratricopeptide repeat protein n=1 Tax=Martelella limonii TaxID=1647649 RepID=UPI001580EEF7|nr:hypothetical protein [Martelella limonii]